MAFSLPGAQRKQIDFQIDCEIIEKFISSQTNLIENYSKMQDAELFNYDEIIKKNLENFDRKIDKICNEIVSDLKEKIAQDISPLDLQAEKVNIFSEQENINISIAQNLRLLEYKIEIKKLFYIDKIINLIGKDYFDDKNSNKNNVFAEKFAQKTFFDYLKIFIGVNSLSDTHNKSFKDIKKLLDSYSQLTEISESLKTDSKKDVIDEKFTKLYDIDPDMKSEFYSNDIVINGLYKELEDNGKKKFDLDVKITSKHLAENKIILIDELYSDGLRKYIGLESEANLRASSDFSHSAAP